MSVSKKVLVLGFVWIMLGCSVYNNEYGFITTSVKLGSKSFNIKAIPPETTKILVSVSGEGLASPIEFELNQSDNRKLIKDVPIGNKNVSAKAFDLQEQILAEGSETVLIKPNQNNVIELVLESKVIKNKVSL